MRQDTYRFALDEAASELRGIVTQFEALKTKKEQIEKAVEALRPFLGLQADTPTVEASTAYVAETSVALTAPEIEEAVSEPVEFSFMQISGPGMEVTKSEPAHEEVVEQVAEPMLAMAEATAEQVAYFRQPSADPFQRRIDDALWGWQQRPEGLLSPI
ncbi:MAG: hypothetical protein WBQ95_15095 [Terracidiphilus sp.]